MTPDEAETFDAVVEGDLALGTLTGVIRKLHEDRRTGVLRIVTDGAERRVYFKWGDVIFANSDDKNDRLDQRLRADGRATPASLAEAYEEQKRTGARFGECLVSMGAMTDQELLAAVERQVRGIIRYLFSISRGFYRFEGSEGPVDDDLMLDLPMQEILLDGVRSIQDPLALRIGVGRLTHVLHPGRGRLERLPKLSVAEGFVLSRVDGETSIVDLISVSPLSELETLRSVCALLAVGLVEAREPAPKLRVRPAPLSPPGPLRLPSTPRPKPVPKPAPATTFATARPAAPRRRQEDGSGPRPKPVKRGLVSRFVSLLGLAVE